MSPSSTPSLSAIWPASSGCERPENTISFFCGPRSIQWPGLGSLKTAPSRPGSARSVGVVRLSMVLVDPAFPGFLAWREPGERSGGDIIGDDRTRRNPSVVANADRSIERIVDTGPDVAADPGRALGLPPLVREIGGDVAGGDVRILADLGVPDVGEVRHLRAGADAGLLQLDERPGLGALAEDGARPEIGEGADGDAGADLGVDRDDVRADLGARGDLRRAAKDGERMDRRVGRDLDAVIDPGRGGIDDGHAGEHVRLVDPVPQRGGHRGELDTRVDPLHLPGHGRSVDCDRVAVYDEQPQGIRQIELAMRVVRLEPLEGRPESLGT